MSEGGLAERGVQVKQRRAVGDRPDRAPDPVPLRPSPQEVVAARITTLRQEARQAWYDRGVEERLREISLAALQLRLARRAPAQPGETLIELRVIEAFEMELDVALFGPPA